MRNIFCLLCLSLLIPELLSAQVDIPEKKVETSIEAVKLHLQGAEVTRKAKLQLPKGRSLFIFSGLSSKLYSQTIQFSTKAAGVRVLSVTSKLNYLSKSKEDKRIGTIRDSIDLVKDRISALENEQNAYQAEREVLRSNRNTKGSDKALDIELLKAASEYHRQRTLAINQETSKLRKKLEEENRQLFDLKLQLRELNANKLPSSDIYLVVESEQASSSDFELQYVVGDCGWAAVYDLESNDLDNNIELRYRALAFNNTGVDWEEVNLTLATADPLQSSTQPTLSVWNIDDFSSSQINNMANTNINNQINIQQNIQQKKQLSFNYKQEARDILGEDFEEGVDYETERFREMQRNRANAPTATSATLDVPEFNVDFEIKDPYTIPSDRKPYSIDVKTEKLAANYKYFAVPKLDKDAFLLVQVVDWEELNLISGPVNIYNTNRYMGQSYLNIRNVNDTLNISLGRDKDVVVTRTKVKGSSKKQLIGSAKKASVAYDIDVRNNHKKAISIEIIDQIPITSDKDVTITLDAKGDASFDEKTGELLWQFTLPPSKTKKLNFGFSIKYPKDKRVNIQYNKSRRVQQQRYF